MTHISIESVQRRAAFRFRHVLAASAGVLLLVACSTPPPTASTQTSTASAQKPAPVISAPPAAPVAPAPPKAHAPEAPDAVLEHVDYDDTSKFDSSLSDTLDKKPGSLTIVPTAPISPNEIPPRLEKWFNVIVKSGGTVKMQKAPPLVTAENGEQVAATRGFLFEFVDLAVTAYDYVHDMNLYAPAKKYDAVVVYRGSEIQDITFKRRVP